MRTETVPGTLTVGSHQPSTGRRNSSRCG